MRIFKIVALSLVSALAGLSVLAAGLCTVNYIRCAEFYFTAEDDGLIPGINDGFVPEGYCTAPEGVLVSGYMKDTGAARVYLIREDGETNYTNLLDDSLEPFISRASGIAFYDGYMYVTGKEGLYMFYYEDVRDKLEETDYYGIIETYIEPEWCAIDDDKTLYVGSCSAGRDIPEWQSTEAPSGEKFSELITVFRLDPDIKFAIKRNPICAIAAPQNIQGAHIDRKGFIFSASDGGFGSSFMFYFLDTDIHGTVTVEKNEQRKTLPLYYLSENTKTHEISAPAMMEGIISDGNKIYALGKSAASENLYGRLFGLEKFYNIKISDKYYQ